MEKACENGLTMKCEILGEYVNKTFDVILQSLIITLSEMIYEGINVVFGRLLSFLSFRLKIPFIGPLDAGTLCLGRTFSVSSLSSRRENLAFTSYRKEFKL